MNKQTRTVHAIEFKDAAINRSHWQNLDQQLSPFQKSAFEMQTGTPYRAL